MENDLILYTTDDGQSQLVLRELGAQEARYLQVFLFQFLLWGHTRLTVRIAPINAKRVTPPMPIAPIPKPKIIAIAAPSAAPDDIPST